jgi:CheY-like chemotaxis protein
VRPAQKDAGAGSRSGVEPPLVVIVDPSRDFRTILGTLFEHRGYAAAATDDPDQALAWARTRRPAVLIGEHPLPLSDGRVLCDALMEDPRTASIPFVAVTAVAFAEDLAHARDSHRHGVFAKPIKPSRIFDHVDTLLSP